MNCDPEINEDDEVLSDDSQNLVTIAHEQQGLSPLKIPQCLLALLDDQEEFEIQTKAVPQTEFNFYEDSAESDRYPPDFDESDSCDAISREQMQDTIRGLESGSFRQYLSTQGVDLQGTLDMIGKLPPQKQQRIIGALGEAEKGNVGRLEKQCRKLHSNRTK